MTVWRFFRGLAGLESGRWCRACGEALDRRDLRPQRGCVRAVPGRRVRAAELTGSTAAARDAVHYLLTSPSLGGRLGPMLVCDGVDWPAVLAEAEAMSGGQRLLLYAAYDLWAAEGVVGISELARGLDRSSFERLVGALQLYRGDDGAAAGAPRRSLRRRPLRRRLVHVASRGERDAGDGEADRPREQHRAAGGGRRRWSVVSPVSASCAWTGPKRPTEGTKAKRRFSTTKPQASRPMIAPTWLRTIDAEPDADRAPECDAGERAQHQQRDLAAVEREGDATAREDSVADPEAEPFSDDAEREPGEQSCGQLRREHA